MKEVLKELDRGLLKAGKWFLYSKAFEHFASTILLLIVIVFWVIVGAWVYKQIAMMGW